MAQTSLSPLAASESPGRSTAPQFRELVDVNTASAELLRKSVPKVGAILAQRIVDFREVNGPFKGPEDLMHVPGIGRRLAESLFPAAEIGSSVLIDVRQRTLAPPWGTPPVDANSVANAETEEHAAPPGETETNAVLSAEAEASAVFSAEAEGNAAPSSETEAKAVFSGDTEATAALSSETAASGVFSAETPPVLAAEFVPEAAPPAPEPPPPAVSHAPVPAPAPRPNGAAIKVTSLALAIVAGLCFGIWANAESVKRPTRELSERIDVTRVEQERSRMDLDHRTSELRETQEAVKALSARVDQESAERKADHARLSHDMTNLHDTVKKSKENTDARIQRLRETLTEIELYHGANLQHATPSH